MKEQYEQELFLKPGAYVHLANDIVEKHMDSREVEAYGVLSQYREQLHDNSISVVVPRLVDYNEDSSIGRLTNIGDFRHFSCPEYFGKSDIYVPSYYAAIHGVANIIRTTIPAHVIPNGRDYEAMQLGQTSMIDYLVSGLKGDEPEEIHDLLRVAETVNKGTQSDVMQLPLFAGHLDPNPNNFLKQDSDDGTSTIAVVDWETFGLSRVGYDEGRLMSYIALDSEKQEEYGEFAQEVFSRDELQYFWRVAINRCVREYISFNNGHYDSRLAVSIEDGSAQADIKQDIMDGLTDIVRRSVGALNSLGLRI